MLLRKSLIEAPIDRGVVSARYKIRNVLASKLARTLILALACILIVLSCTNYYEVLTSPISPTGRHGEARVHLLVPATSSNPDLCKLLLSAQILGYPAPILINYGATEFEDPYVQHLAKVQGVVNYLNKIQSEAQRLEEIVLMVDGYDVFFQLGLRVVLERYYKLTADLDERAAVTYGRRLARKQDMRHTVVFGPDKICWPIDFNRPACWAVPRGSLKPNAFGPQTDRGRETHNLPRWLNSGTVIGPVDDVKAVFEATLEEIEKNNGTVVSDQYYLAEVFGKQSYVRLLNKPQLLEEYKAARHGEEIGDTSIVTDRRSPELVKGEKTEYHIAIDYESSIFQTIAFWKQYLTWTRGRDSWPDDNGSQASLASAYHFKVPADVKASKILLDPKEDGSYVHGNRSWEDASLLYNTVTGQAPASVHFTGDKMYRHYWWRNVWFLQDAEKLRQASLSIPSWENKPFGPINGLTFYNAQPLEAEEMNMRVLDGAWSDRGGWFSWKSLCKRFEEEIYTVPSNKLYHANAAALVK